MSSSLKLLLVNSDDSKCKQLSHFIETLNVFEVLTARTGSEAIEHLRNNEIRVLVSDIEIEGLDGWRLSRMVRSGIFKCAAETPIIVVASTWCEHIAETTAREFGINHMLPYEDTERLAQVLADSLSNDIQQSDKTSILAIEDNPDTQILVQRILKNRFEVDIAGDGKEGLLKWRQNKHHIILLDVMLPGMTGEEVLEAVLNENPTQPVVVMTAHGTVELAEKMIIRGAADFITKPFRAEQLRKICEIASRREDFIISNEQFAEKVRSLQEREVAYRKVSEAHQHLLNNLTSVVMELDKDGNVKFTNRAWQKLTGFDDDETLSQPITDFICQDFEETHGLFGETLKDLLSGRIRKCDMEFKLTHKAGRDLWVEGRLALVSAESGIAGVTMSIDNITKRKEAELRLEHLALHDTLTGLNNRYFFDNELNRLSLLSKREEGPHALLYIDLDHFKVINDTQGHHQGDMVLKEVASSIKARLRESDTVCRIGGDEFAVLLTNTPILDAHSIAEEICHIVQKGHYQFGDQVFTVSCSIGATAIDGSSLDSHEYLKQADIALYVAKRRGRDIVHVYTENDRDSEDLKHSIEWVQKLQQAISSDSIILHFQPVINIQTRQVAYYEALVRLIIDEKLIYPGNFIPALERAEDMKLLDHQVVGKAIKMLYDYPDVPRIAINLSAQAFSDDKLTPLIESKLKQYNVDPTRVIFELTESASLTNLAATQRMVSTLAELGCDFSIDDFGTGFSTFSYLKQLPAKSVKIDGSFVKDMTNDPIDVALVKAIKEVAKSLNKVTVAEFVENEETLNLLGEIGVDYAQGYHIAKPAEIDHFLKED